jgi:hemolysin III
MRFSSPLRMAPHRSTSRGSRAVDFPQARGEEIANSVSHGVGLLAGLAAAPFLILTAVRGGRTSAVVGTSVFAATVVVLYLASTLYHALRQNRAKRVFQILDRAAIFLLIAGTYTPFTLGVLRGPWGWTLFGVVWSLAGAGLLLTAVSAAKYTRLSTALYLGMGWLALLAIQPLRQHLPHAGLLWLVAGGLAYTGGVAFLALKGRLRYAHFIWHMFVLAGTGCHVVAVARYAN